MLGTANSFSDKIANSFKISFYTLSVHYQCADIVSTGGYEISRKSKQFLIINVNVLGPQKRALKNAGFGKSQNKDRGSVNINAKLAACYV